MRGHAPKAVVGPAPDGEYEISKEELAKIIGKAAQSPKRQPLLLEAVPDGRQAHEAPQFESR